MNKFIHFYKINTIIILIFIVVLTLMLIKQKYIHKFVNWKKKFKLDKTERINKMKQSKLRVGKKKIKKIMKIL